jgi:hypothetical protein
MTGVFELNDVARLPEGEAGPVKSWSSTAYALMSIHFRLPSRLVREGWAGGREGPRLHHERRRCVPKYSTPHLNPPPQGGRTLMRCLILPTRREDTDAVLNPPHKGEGH